MEHAPCRLKQAKLNIIDAYKVVLLKLLDEKYIMEIGKDTIYLNDRGSRNRKTIDDIVIASNKKAGYIMGFTHGREGSPVTISLDPKKSDIITVADELQRLEDLQANSKSKSDIEELFDSNPELANQVYEALGFKVTPLLEDKYIKKVNKILIKDKSEDEKKLSEGNFNLKYGFAFYEDIEDLKNGDFRLVQSNAPKSGAQGGNLYVLELKNRGYDTANAVNNTPGYIVIGRENRIRYIEVDKKYRKLGIATLLTNLYRSQYGDTGFSLINNPNIFKITEKLSGKKIDNVTTDIPKLTTEITPQQKQQALQLYSQYLNTIFPDSKVKDIVYHGSFDKIKDYQKNKIKNGGFYFTKNINYPKDLLGTPNINSIVLNVKNPVISNEFADFLKKEQIENYSRTNDAFIGKSEISNEDEIVVFEPEQIHILGNKQDIEGFKEFVKKPNNKSKPGEQLSLFSDEEIIEQLVQENKLKRKC
jgi:ribosomal protein S18 acetylase RimI-like enzyme